MKVPKKIANLKKKAEKKFTPQAIMKHLFDNKEFRKLIIDLNTEDQLFEQGIDSKGRSLGDYSIATIEGTSNFRGKKQKGQRYDHITLKDTGDFYRSFRIELTGSTFKIVADGQKEETNLFAEYGIDIIGLTQFNMSVVMSAAVPIIQKYIKSVLINE